MSNLEKLMQEYQPDERILEDAMAADGMEKMTGEEKEHILWRTLEKAGLQGGAEQELRWEQSLPEDKRAADENRNHAKKNVFPPWKKRRRAALAAACIALFAVAGIGYATGSLDSAFKSWFAPSTEEQLEALESAGTAIGAEVTDQGTTVRVREAIGDEGSVNVLLDIIAPEGTVLDADQYAFYRPLVSVQGSHGLGYSFSELEKAEGRGNVYTAILSLSSEGSLVGKNMSLDLTDLCVYKSEDQRKAEETGAVLNDEEYLDDCYRVVLPGNWKLEFPLDYKDTSVKVYPNVAVVKEDQKVRVTELRVSPISLSIEMTNRGLGDAVSYVLNGSVSENRFGAEGDIQVTMKDGTVLPQRSAGSFSEGFQAKLDMQFTEIIDMTQIDSILFCGEELWKNK